MYGCCTRTNQTSLAIRAYGHDLEFIHGDLELIEAMRGLAPRLNRCVRSVAPSIHVWSEGSATWRISRGSPIKRSTPTGTASMPSDKNSQSETDGCDDERSQSTPS